MKLTLHRCDLTRRQNPWLPYNYDVTLDSFPDHIRKTARFVNVVEYKDGEFTKLLKDTGRSVTLEAKAKGFDTITEFLSGKNLNVSFSTCLVQEDEKGIKRIVLER